MRNVLPLSSAQTMEMDIKIEHRSFISALRPARSAASSSGYGGVCKLTQDRIRSKINPRPKQADDVVSVYLYAYGKR